MSGLRTGWEPETPDADILLRQAVYNFTDFNVGIAEQLGARVEWSEELALADLGRPGEFLNSATLLQPPGPDGAALMDRIEKFFLDPAATGHVDLWSAWPTADLEPRGWQRQGHPPLMIRPPGGARPAPPQGLDIRGVSGPDEVHEFEDAVKKGFGAPDGPSFLDERVLEHAGLRLWLGYLDGRPVSTAAVCISRGVNGVQMITTAPEARGRGFGEAMTWTATLADPLLPAVLLASDLGRPVYERMGYLSVLRFTYWRLPRGGD